MEWSSLSNDVRHAHLYWSALIVYWLASISKYIIKIKYCDKIDVDCSESRDRLTMLLKWHALLVSVSWCRATRLYTLGVLHHPPKFWHENRKNWNLPIFSPINSFLAESKFYIISAFFWGIKRHFCSKFEFSKILGSKIDEKTQKFKIWGIETLYTSKES